MNGSQWGAYDLSVRFGRRVALERVSIEVRPGEVTAVCGGDGAGKTTLLRALAGGVRPASGRVHRPERARIGYVAGVSGLYADLSVDENIAFVAAAYGLHGADHAARTRALLGRIGLEGTGDRLAGRLSGGMRQKLAFALAMLHKPDLLILDEPTTGLDPVSRAELWRLIAGVAADGAGVVVSTSYPGEAERAGSVVFLEAGRMASTSDGEPEPISGAVAVAAPAYSVQSAPHRATAADKAPLARTDGVSRHFGRMVAVDDVDVRIEPGEVVGLLGANGAGKTTLIRVLLGLIPPSSGRVELFGAPPSRAARRRIGYVPQTLGLWEDMTVRENLAFVASSFSCSPPPLEPDLSAVADTVVRDLPLGLRRRLAFAAALAHGPELLMLDEPTSGVDVHARVRLWDTVHAAARNGAGVLVTTHHMEEAGECDRLVVMAAARVVAQGTLASMLAGRHAVSVAAARWEQAFTAFERAGMQVALVGRDLRVPDADPAAVLRVLDAHGLAADVSVVPATFEEAFVALALGGETRTPRGQATAPGPSAGS